MAFIKYSVGGPITSVKDENSVEKREDKLPSNSMEDRMSHIIVCTKCGIQHMILQGELSRSCFCGHIIKIAELS
jgi:hypothetical protein